MTKIVTAIFKKFKRSFRKLLSSISPTFASKVFYKRAFKKKLDLKNPITLNEKLMWLKLNTYNNNSLVTKCADKYLVRDYVKDCGCDEILNGLIDVWDSVDEIDWTLLPNKFVLKCNHGSGYNILCDDKNNFNISGAHKKIKHWMREEYWKIAAETYYKDVRKKILCEEYIESEDKSIPDDYKIYCFHGVPTYVMLCVDRDIGTPKFYFFDNAWNLKNLNKDSKELSAKMQFKKPVGIEKMFEYASILSRPFPFVRADFYLVDGRVYFGELTFTPAAALDVKRLPETDLLFGKMLDISRL